MILPFLLLCLPIALCTGDDLDFPGCPGRDRCSDISNSDGAMNFLQRNCECDSDCVEFGDCCEDYHRDDAQQRKNNISDHPMSCVGLDNAPENMGVYMVVNCPAGTEPSLRKKCEDNDEGPVTVFPNGPTYLNHHCALCNGHALDGLIRWDDSPNPPYYYDDVECELALRPFYLSKSYYQSNRGGWDEMIDSKTYNNCYLRFIFSTLAPHSYLRPIDVSSERDDLFNMDISEVPRREPKFKLSDLFASKYSKVGRRGLPPNLGRLRLCRPYLVSECPLGYNDERVREACSGGYEAAVYGLFDAYRNPHCALCNDEDLRTLVCDPSELHLERGKEVPFSNMFGAGHARQKTNCKENQSYDRKSKKCRNVRMG